VTPYSTNEPIPFTAYCTVSVVSSTNYTPGGTAPCKLNGNVATNLAPISGLAYTWGYGLTVTFDPAIFAPPVGAIGTSAKVTVFVTPNGGSTINLAYKYIFQPVDP